jgi:cytosine/uracil/thiamine/allantoin permease
MSSTQLAVAAIIAATVASLVFFHAERNKIRHPFAWASAVFLFLAIGLPLYALHVRRVRRSRQL